MKKILLCFMIALFSMSLQGQTMLVVNPLESWQKTYSFPLSEISSLSFSNGKMNVELASADAAVIPLSEIAELRFDNPGGIEAPTLKSEPTAVYDRLTESLTVGGTTGKTTLAIYGIDGRMWLSLPAYAGESVDVSSLPRGIYAVVVDSLSVKFAK